MIERFAVGISLRHLLDVRLKADRCVLVGVHIIGDILHLLVQQGKRAGDALPVLAVDCTRLCLKLAFGIRKVPEAVALHFNHLFEIDLRKIQMIGRVVIRRIGIGVGTDIRHQAVIHRPRIFLRAAEHHMFEEVRKSRLAWFVFVPASRTHDGVVRDKPGALHRYYKDRKSVGQDFRCVCVRKEGICHGHASCQKEKDKTITDDTFHAGSKFFRLLPVLLSV